MPEGVGAQPEEKPQDRVRLKFKDFFKDANKEAPKYHALDDFVSIERLKHQEHTKPGSIEARQSIIDRNSARSPLYREAFETIMEFAIEFQLAYEEQWLKMAKASEGQLSVRLEDIWLVVDSEFATALGSLNIHRNHRAPVAERDRRKLQEKAHA